ncbi:RHS repeat-associated protein [Kerstersia gyiorum]|uniref:RHS repeat-associated protein n=2 Tax=Kerstersia gyiorum TaxID=206506 RepID=A0A4Q7MVE6_9BURK|nr:RHS repeat-associated protein [Kerstersia gyiorum]
MHIVPAPVAAQTAAPLSCPATQLGQPCSGAGLASAGAAEPELNLGLDNPVHLASGRKYLRDTDLPAHPLAPGLELVRHYNSADPRLPGNPGRGWQFSYDLRLYRQANTLQLIQADGSRLRFSCLPGHTSCTHDRQGLVQADGQGWQWRWPDGARLDFREDGWLAAIRRSDGLLLARLERAQDGRLLAVHSATPGRQLAFHYLQQDKLPPRLTGVDTPAGRFRYHHAALADGWFLSGVERPDGMQRHYGHDPALQHGHPQAITASGLSAAGQPVQWQRRWHYDSDGRVSRVEHLTADGQPGAAWRLEYLEPAHGIHAGLTRVHGARGTTDIHYVLAGGRHRLARVAGVACPGCPAPGLSASYDAAGRLTRLNDLLLLRRPDGSPRQLVLPGSGWTGLKLDYDSQGRMVSWHSERTGTTRLLRRFLAARHTEGRTPPEPPATATRQISIRYANGDRWRAWLDHAGRPWRISATSTAATSTGLADAADTFRAEAGESAHATAVRSVPAPAGAHVVDTRITWRDGKLAMLEHPHETERRSHDSNGRLLSRSLHRPGADSTPEIAVTDRYAYHPDGRLARHYLPEGGVLSYEWQQGRLSRLDWHDRHGTRHAILHHLPGSGGYVYGNGVRTVGLRDEHGLRYLLSSQPGTATPILAQAIRLDAQGRIIEERFQTGDWRQHLRYGYAASGRLALAENTAAHTHSDTNAKGHVDVDASPRISYLAWHADGRLLARNDTAPPHPPAPSTRPQAHHVARLGPEPEPTVVDASGLPVAHEGWRLTYDAQRRLQRASQPATGLRIDYRNNAHGQRIRRASGQDITHYLHDSQGLRVALALPAQPGQAARITERYLYAGQVPVAWLRYDSHGDANLYFLHSDAQGLPRALSDSRGHLAWRAEFDAFGRLLREHGGPRPSPRYPGQHADPALPWHDNGMRTYDPGTGSYLEPDPLGPQPGHDAYGYAAQRPRQYADPAGMLLYAFDGTRNTPASLTNVWLLHQLYPGGGSYQPGPGQNAWDAATASRATHIIGAQWERLLADLAAAGRQWQQEPAAIDLLGYSRGAALAQHFANQIAAHVRNQRFWAYDPLMGTVSACVDLRFMGLFDTVAQFGVNGRDNADYLLGASPAWQWIAHAVALNEHRYLFPLNSLAQGQGNLVEMPFIGAHADIGGGYLSRDTPDATRGDLSDVALAWMHWQARAAGVPLAPLPEAQATVSQPLLHDERNVFYRKTGQDRPVRHADGSPWLHSQAEHPGLGATGRNEVEAFIERLPDWMHTPGSVVGSVDMAAYEQWLARQMQR